MRVNRRLKKVSRLSVHMTAPEILFIPTPESQGTLVSHLFGSHAEPGTWEG